MILTQPDEVVKNLEILHRRQLRVPIGERVDTEAAAWHNLVTQWPLFVESWCIVGGLSATAFKCVRRDGFHVTKAGLLSELLLVGRVLTLRSWSLFCPQVPLVRQLIESELLRQLVSDLNVLLHKLARHASQLNEDGQNSIHGLYLLFVGRQSSHILIDFGLNIAWVLLPLQPDTFLWFKEFDVFFDHVLLETFVVAV